MMKQLSTIKLRHWLVLGFLTIFTQLFSQKQLELISHLDYVSLANDVWGYTAPDGTEYALVGLHGGVSVVSLADPANPDEIQFIPGDQSTWRDLKTWGHFAYVTADQPGSKDGILVIDLSGLPTGVTWSNWRPVLPGQIDSLYTCHNLYIDENGYCYLSGCDQNSGGPIIIDVFTTPGQPQFVSYTPPVYAHDCFAQNNLLYTAEIYKGQFSVLDVSDKQNIQLLATQHTPFDFCHNVWANADGSVLYTTDERANAPTSAYDLSDLNNIKLLDEFRPVSTLGTGVIPHNAHAYGDYIVIANYTDGCVIVDATRPDNLIEVESYDTSTDYDNGFHGCWGTYPYFPSGLIAATDIENGLFILKPTYPKVAYLEGKISDSVTNLPITGASIKIQSSDANAATSSFTGDYKTGQATAGGFAVVFKAKGYFDLSLPVTLVAGEIVLLDAPMVPLPEYQLTGSVIELQSEQPIAGALVSYENEDFKYTAVTDQQGNFTMNGVKKGDYEQYIGHWGYENLSGLAGFGAGGNLPPYKLDFAYQDDFNNDLGWSVESTATKGLWERGKPLGVRAANKQFAPDSDSAIDPGNYAFVTGNTGILVQDDQVDDGETRLTSPPMQLRSRYNRPMLAFDYWWLDAISNNVAHDSLVVSISNGLETKVLTVIATDTATVQAWTPSDTFDLANLLAITDDMRITFTASDRPGTPNIVEAGLDNFRVWDGIREEQLTTKDDLAKFRIYPNPSADHVTVDYKINNPFKDLRLIVVNVLGQTIREVQLQEPLGRVELQMINEVAAPYFITFRVDGKLSKAGKLMKVID
ncbi:MAG: choice-of-anchor B family protein [Saprospiraceae bacterium]|nr:choice-of-anchor B family protein [Saprospiraceae bacterium]MCF8250406.1 choice-of-anchor B family protein [Saprospiraceae bacterium]MCF8280674.1 choice-of-anchor B family protein [Bacteroidales bacterium]MCF8312219.1 choice-of-anchor B family protein [Saprospiraceae bacterium]MCF8440560.1 choice-of-anchor B family protein [Saprospiraceae bacterium]